MKSSKKPSKEEIDSLLKRGVTEVFDRAHLEKALKSGKKLRVKLGFDPTGSKIHIGRAIVLRKLKAFQDLGHKVVFIVGDFTAQIGDPSDKLAKRPMLSEKDVLRNLKDYKAQVGKIIDLKKAEFRFNSEWLPKLDFKEMANLAESFTVQQMLQRRNFKERFKKGEEISIREFLYPLLQGYDSVMVKADVELGGFDQLFNLQAGRVIQKYYGQEQQDIMTSEMLEGTDGRKMSTSWGNVINITDPANEMFAKVMAINDELIYKYFMLCTNLKESEINGIVGSIESGIYNPREAKFILAREIVTLYHSAKEATKAEDEFRRVFQKKELPSKIKTVHVKKTSLALRDLVFLAGLASSKGDAHRLVIQGGVSIDGVKSTNPKAEIRVSSKGTILKVGKDRFVKAVI